MILTARRNEQAKQAIKHQTTIKELLAENPSTNFVDQL
jgi:hypothetical protein